MLAKMHSPQLADTVNENLIGGGGDNVPAAQKKGFLQGILDGKQNGRFKFLVEDGGQELQRIYFTFKKECVPIKAVALKSSDQDPLTAPNHWVLYYSDKEFYDVADMIKVHTQKSTVFTDKW